MSKKHLPKVFVKHFVQAGEVDDQTWSQSKLKTKNATQTKFSSAVEWALISLANSVKFNYIWSNFYLYQNFSEIVSPKMVTSAQVCPSIDNRH